jgi:hypothetical protein
MYVWERLHVHPWTADFRPCAPQAKIYRFAPFYLICFFIYSKLLDFLTIWWKAPFWLVENKKKKKKKKDGYLGDPARGQADLGSADVYNMDWPGPVICMYVCVGTVSRGLRPTDPLVVAIGSYVQGRIPRIVTLPRFFDSDQKRIGKKNRYRI